LCDLRKDPNLLNNVAADKKYAKIKAKFSVQLMEVLENAHEPRLKDEFDYPPYVEKKL